MGLNGVEVVTVLLWVDWINDLLVIIAALEINGLIGKQGPMASVKGVIHGSLTLTAVLFGILIFC